jgi:putative protein-disulfide isomerase
MTELTYLYDPLCGWCYGAAPALHALLETPGVHVTLAPSGLFAGGDRRIDAGFAAYIEQADRRISAMSGQEFSDAYRRNVLHAADARIDSGPATLAVTAAWMEDAAHEADALAAIQRARYVEGRDVTDLAALAEVLAALGLAQAAARIAAPDAALVQAAQARVTAAQTTMARLGIGGVPALVAEGERIVPNGALFGERAALLRLVCA